MTPRQFRLPAISRCAGRLLPVALLVLLALSGLTVQHPLNAGSQLGRADDWQMGQAGLVLRDTLARGLHPGAATADGGDSTDDDLAVDRTPRLPRAANGPTHTSSPAARLLAPGVRPQSPRAPPTLV